jgi:hypothetical protein
LSQQETEDDHGWPELSGKTANPPGGPGFKSRHPDDLAVDVLVRAVLVEDEESWI